MRIAAQVSVAYVALLLMAALWRLLPLSVAPDLVALFAVYLGLTARPGLFPSAVGAMLIGYLADLLMGTPRGTLALTGLILCIAAYLIHRRLLVRGWLVTALFAALAAVSSGVTVLAIRSIVDTGTGSFTSELVAIAGAAALTGLVGPAGFRLCRRVDARFARTQRERTAALEGLIP